MTDLDQLYLDNIDEYVQDQDKIVTYKWLSLTLGVHVNTAKQMLFHYLEHKRRESGAALHATFLLSGKAVDQGRTCHKVCVVREEELEDAKSRLSAVASVHVYSVHKALLRDSAPLFGVDYDAVKSNLHQCNRFSAIRCPDAVPLSKAELHQSRESRPPPPPAQTSDTTKPQTNASSKPAPKPKGIMGIFAKAKAESKAEPKPEPKPEPAETEAPKPPKSSSKSSSKSSPGLNFFGKTAPKKPVPSVKEEQRPPQADEQRPPQADGQRPPQADGQRPPQADGQRPPQADAPPSGTERVHSKSKRAESDEEEPQEKKKKRRRIRKPQSDSSDDEVIPDSPVQTQTPPPPPEPSVQDEEPDSPERPSAQPENPATKTRKRRRVLKSKTFMDEDGCMVTEKVYESESFSEDDEPPTKAAPAFQSGPRAAPKAAALRPQAEDKRKRNAAAKSTKQPSIAGFFNKK